MDSREISRSLRKRQTPTEKILWEKLRNRQLIGKKFLRQHPIKVIINNDQRFFIADFYCAEHKLIVEADGKIHERRTDYDKLRDWIINQMGFSIIRFTNEEIENNVDNVLERIISTMRI